ncbi:MAG: T9SS type A sorting domain-containing protein [Bacteroidetes bacterium]|nr:T9SS type A sorting domain-containing protein [Bacteroidota bacterium]
MKNIYTLTIALLLLFSLSGYGQARIYAPTLNEPENGDIEQVPDVLLNWSAVTGNSLVIMYELQLSNTEDFSSPITFPQTDVTSYAMSNLLFGQQYFWRVRAYDGDEVSDWSEIWSFRIIYSIKIDKPNDNAMVFANPLIEWDEVTGLTHFELQIDTAYSWSIIPLEITNDLNTTFIVDENNMWAGGNSGLILHFDGTAWTTSESGVTENISDIWFTSSTNGYAVGESGLVLHYDGSAWTPETAVTSEDLLGVYFLDENMGWAVGKAGAILAYNSGTWTQITTSHSGDLYDVYALSGDDIWVCGLPKIIGHFDGTDWSFETISNRDLYSIWFTDANNGWAVGKGGRIVYYNGSEWTEQESGVTKDLLSVSFTGSMGYAVGKNGTFLVYDGYWYPEAAGSPDQLNSVFVNNDLGLISGVGGILISKAGDAFNSPVATTYIISADSIEFQLDYLLFGTDYYYRMRGLHALDTTAWSGTKKMTTYAATELDSPGDGSSNLDLLLEFTWDEYEGVTNYILEIDSNANFTLPRTFGPDQNIETVNDFVFGTEYFWRVKAQHFNDISDWSETWTFTTTNMIVLESPENEATDVLQCPRYEWEAVAGASKYGLWLDTDINFSNPLKITSDSAFFQCQSSLEQKTVYYWKVRGLAGASISDWSEVWSFETEGPDGIDENFDAHALQIYPNPSNGEFTVQINSLINGIYHLSVVDLVGKKLYEQDIDCNVGENAQKFNLQHLEKGIYLVHIKKGEGTVTKKLFIQ